MRAIPAIRRYTRAYTKARSRPLSGRLDSSPRRRALGVLLPRIYSPD